MKFQITFLGASSLFGRVASALLKQSPTVKTLKLYDELEYAGTESSANEGTCNVQFHRGKDQLTRALEGSHIIVIGDESKVIAENEKDYLFTNASKVVDYSFAISHIVPKAMLVVAAKPLNLMVPLVGYVLKELGSYDGRKLLGVTSIDTLRANALYSSYLRQPNAILPVVGGSSPQTRVPIFSQAKPCIDLPLSDQNQLIDEIKSFDIVLEEQEARSSAIERAYATVRLVHSVMSGLLDEPFAAEMALAKTTLIPEASYFSLPVDLGRSGIERTFGLPELSPMETEMIDFAVINLNNDIMKAQDLYQNFKPCLEMFKKFMFPPKNDSVQPNRTMCQDNELKIHLEKNELIHKTTPNKNKTNQNTRNRRHSNRRKPIVHCPAIGVMKDDTKAKTFHNINKTHKRLLLNQMETEIGTNELSKLTYTRTDENISPTCIIDQSEQSKELGFQTRGGKTAPGNFINDKSASNNDTSNNLEEYSKVVENHKDPAEPFVQKVVIEKIEVADNKGLNNIEKFLNDEKSFCNYNGKRLKCPPTRQKDKKNQSTNKKTEFNKSLKKYSGVEYKPFKKEHSKKLIYNLNRHTRKIFWKNSSKEIGSIGLKDNTREDEQKKSPFKKENIILASSKQNESVKLTTEDKNVVCTGDKITEDSTIKLSDRSSLKKEQNKTEYLNENINIDQSMNKKDSEKLDDHSKTTNREFNLDSSVSNDVLSKKEQNKTEYLKENIDIDLSIRKKEPTKIDESSDKTFDETNVKTEMKYTNNKNNVDKISIDTIHMKKLEVESIDISKHENKLDENGTMDEKEQNKNKSILNNVVTVEIDKTKNSNVTMKNLNDNQISTFSNKEITNKQYHPNNINSVQSINNNKEMSKDETFIKKETDNQEILDDENKLNSQIIPDNNETQFKMDSRENIKDNEYHNNINKELKINNVLEACKESNEKKLILTNLPSKVKEDKKVRGGKQSLENVTSYIYNSKNSTIKKSYVNIDDMVQGMVEDNYPVIPDEPKSLAVEISCTCDSNNIYRIEEPSAKDKVTSDPTMTESKHKDISKEDPNKNMVTTTTYKNKDKTVIDLTIELSIDPNQLKPTTVSERKERKTEGRQKKSSVETKSRPPSSDSANKIKTTIIKNVKVVEDDNFKKNLWLKQKEQSDPRCKNITKIDLDKVLETKKDVCINTHSIVESFTKKEINKTKRVDERDQCLKQKSYTLNTRGNNDKLRRYTMLKNGQISTMIKEDNAEELKAKLFKSTQSRSSSSTNVKQEWNSSEIKDLKEELKTDINGFSSGRTSSGAMTNQGVVAENKSKSSVPRKVDSQQNGNKGLNLKSKSCFNLVLNKISKRSPTLNDSTRGSHNGALNYDYGKYPNKTVTLTNQQLVDKAKEQLNMLRIKGRKKPSSESGNNFPIVSKDNKNYNLQISKSLQETPMEEAKNKMLKIKEKYKHLKKTKSSPNSINLIAMKHENRQTTDNSSKSQKEIKKLNFEKTISNFSEKNKLDNRYGKELKKIEELIEESSKFEASKPKSKDVPKILLEHDNVSRKDDVKLKDETPTEELKINQYQEVVEEPNVSSTLEHITSSPPTNTPPTIESSSKPSAPTQDKRTMIDKPKMEQAIRKTKSDNTIKTVGRKTNKLNSQVEDTMTKTSKAANLQKTKPSTSIKKVPQHKPVTAEAISSKLKKNEEKKTISYKPLAKDKKNNFAVNPQNKTSKVKIEQSKVKTTNKKGISDKGVVGIFSTRTSQDFEKVASKQRALETKSQHPSNQNEKTEIPNYPLGFGKLVGKKIMPNNSSALALLIDPNQDIKTTTKREIHPSLMHAVKPSNSYLNIELSKSVNNFYTRWSPNSLKEIKENRQNLKNANQEEETRPLKNPFTSGKANMTSEIFKEYMKRNRSSDINPYSEKSGSFLQLQPVPFAPAQAKSVSTKSIVLKDQRVNLSQVDANRDKGTIVINNLNNTKSNVKGSNKNNDSQKPKPFITGVVQATDKFNSPYNTPQEPKSRTGVYSSYKPYQTKFGYYKTNTNDIITPLKKKEKEFKTLHMLKAYKDQDKTEQKFVELQKNFKKQNQKIWATPIKSSGKSLKYLFDNKVPEEPQKRLHLLKAYNKKTESVETTNSNRRSHSLPSDYHPSFPLSKPKNNTKPEKGRNPEEVSSSLKKRWTQLLDIFQSVITKEKTNWESDSPRDNALKNINKKLGHLTTVENSLAPLRSNTSKTNDTKKDKNHKRRHSAGAKISSRFSLRPQPT